MDDLEEKILVIANERIRSKKTMALYVKSRLTAQGIEVSDVALKEIEQKLENLKIDKITIEAIELTLSEDAKEFKLDLSNAQEFEDFMSSISEKILLEVVQEVAEEFSEKILTNLRTKSLATLKGEQHMQAWFETIHKKKWGQALDLLELFLVKAREVSSHFSDERKDRADKRDDFVWVCVTRLQARACQIALEVLTLLKAGLAAGAITRWRSLHEASVTAYFIIKHGREVAERYYHYDAIESYNAAKDQQVYASRLNMEPLTPNEWNSIEDKRNQLITRFGNPYGSGNYGWAATAFPDKKKIDYKDIEGNIDLDHLRPYYRLASTNIHTSPRGLFSQLGLHPDSEDELLTGPSIYGLSIPGQLTAISLLQITISFLDLDIDVEVLVWINVLNKLQHDVITDFVDAEED